MPTLEQVNDFIHSNLNKVTTKRGGTHFHARCPFCGDSKKSQSKKRFHLYFTSKESIGFICYNCDKTGNFYDLYAHIEGISKNEVWKKFNKYNSDNIKSKLKSDQIGSKIDHKWVINGSNGSQLKNLIGILDNCISSDVRSDGILDKKYQEILHKFIRERKIEQTLYYCYSGRFSHRIIIPVWHGDKLIYFQGRSIIETQEPKYLNPVVDKSNVILNINNFSKDKYICVTEGILDAYSIGDQGTSILGKELNTKLINTVEEYTDKGIIIVMDNDKDGMEKLDEIVCSFHDRFLYFLVPYKHKNYKDINEIYVNEDVNTYNYIIENSYNWRKLMTKMKLEKWRKL